MREFTDYFNPRESDLDQVLALFGDMATFRDSGQPNEVVYVDRCHQFGIPVFRIDRALTVAYSGSYKVCFPSRKPGNARLCFHDEIEAVVGLSLDEVVDRLFHGFEQPEAIAQHHYSRNTDLGQWGPLDQVTDVPKIVEALDRWKAAVASRHGIIPETSRRFCNEEHEIQ